MRSRPEYLTFIGKWGEGAVSNGNFETIILMKNLQFWEDLKKIGNISRKRSSLFTTLVDEYFVSDEKIPSAWRGER